MMEHILDDRLHDLIDGLLPDEEAREVRGHLECCGECREQHEMLALLVSDLGDLPREAVPARDLWDGIHSRIDGKDADVIEFPGADTAPRGRVSMSWTQLAAAAVVLAFVSGGTVWMAIGTPATGGPIASPSVGPAAVVQTATTRYDEAIIELEQLVEAGKSVLAPETLRTLEESLAIIETAIADARDALAEDPNSQLANRILANNQQAKLRVLQRAAAAIQI